MLPKTADIVIIGGGVMGVSTAYHLARRGLTNVVLIERDEFLGNGATGRCAGGVRVQFSTEVNIRLSLHSLAMFDAFEEETGQAIDRRRCGGLFLLSNDLDMASFRASVALQNKLGAETVMVDPGEIAVLAHSLRLDGVVGGAYNKDDGIVDPNSVVQGYARVARKHGAALLTETSVTGIVARGGRIAGVQTDQGVIETRTVVNAAGAWAGEIGELAGVSLPIVPERQQLVVTSPLTTLPRDFPFVIDFSQRLYFHREGDGLLTGQSMTGRPPTREQTVDADWTVVHLGNAVERLPLLQNARVLAQWAGLYANTPDRHAILGPAGPEGFYVVAGFSGHGFMHGPIAGKLMAEHILDGRARTVDVSALSFERFSGAPVAEGQVV